MIKRAIILLSLLVAPLLLTAPATVWAVDVFKPCDTSKAANKGAVCEDKRTTEDAKGDTNNPLFGSKGILTQIINILSIIIGIVAIIIIILAGLKFVTSGSNPQDITQARERVIYAAVGLMVAALAQVLVRFIIGKVG
ncbi:MAG: hypothetical protein ACR2FM_00310 [Candidatus Saccharimonadales bacterium]